MGDFHRSPSKVWWAMDNPMQLSWPRAASASPGSQDSGFSDTEASPTNHQLLHQNPDEDVVHRTPTHLPRDILKDLSFEENTPKRNFTPSNFREKYSPKKPLTLSADKKPTYYITEFSTPKTCFIPRVQHRSPVLQAKTEPNGRRYRPSPGKLGPRVSRNLFSNTPVTVTSQQPPIEDNRRRHSHHQYAKVDQTQYSRSDSNASSDASSCCDNVSWRTDEEEDDSTGEFTKSDSNNSSARSDGSSARIPENVRSLPLLQSKKFDGVQNLSAPATLPDEQIFRDDDDEDNEEEDSGNEGVTSFVQESVSVSSSDCESELELLFPGPLESPKHTSTPKTIIRKTPLMKQRIENRRARNLLLKYERIERTRAPHTDSVSVQRWLNEIRNNLEPEYTITLQNKPIAEELNQKVAQYAANITAPIRKLQSQVQLVEDEIQKITSDVRNSAPLQQSLAGLIMEFMSKFLNEPDAELTKLCDDLKACTGTSSTNSIGILTKVLSKWQSLKRKFVEREVKLLVEALEDPKSEFHLRAVLTGLTSTTLRNTYLADLVVSSGGIRALLVLCEQCQGSTMRALILRALTSICGTTKAIRLFEQSSGIQILNDILCDKPLRPEPERSEAVSLLALVTSPWIEENQSVRALADYARSLTGALTMFLRTTKCCLNLILCAAALANITGMEPTSIRHLLHHHTVSHLLDAVRRRGPRAAVELLEQVSTLLANMAAIEDAREQLTHDRAPAALLCFLQPGPNGTEAEKSLQQKSAIALSRLCGYPAAAKQVVEMDGVSRLVILCRERQQRYDSDAVLVAALATLRKISENCGCDVINSQDAQELVEPRLLDSFIAYSAQNESYV